MFTHAFVSSARVSGSDDPRELLIPANGSVLLLNGSNCYINAGSSEKLDFVVLLDYAKNPATDVIVDTGSGRIPLGNVCRRIKDDEHFAFDLATVEWVNNKPVAYFKCPKSIKKKLDFDDETKTPKTPKTKKAKIAEATETPADLAPTIITSPAKYDTRQRTDRAAAFKDFERVMQAFEGKLSSFAQFLNEMGAEYLKLKTSYATLKAFDT